MEFLTDENLPCSPMWSHTNHFKHFVRGMMPEAYLFSKTHNWLTCCYWTMEYGVLNKIKNGFSDNIDMTHPSILSIDKNSLPLPISVRNSIIILTRFYLNSFLNNNEDTGSSSLKLLLMFSRNQKVFFNIVTFVFNKCGAFKLSVHTTNDTFYLSQIRKSGNVKTLFKWHRRWRLIHSVFNTLNIKIWKETNRAEFNALIWLLL